MFARIVIPLDGSMTSESALPTATGLAKALNLPMLLIRVVDSSYSAPMVGVGAYPSYELNYNMIEEERNDARTYIDNMTEHVARDGLNVEPVLIQGPVAQGIVDSTVPGDLIVMSSHGRTGVSRWFLGSVAEQVLRRARVPVLLHREQEDEDEEEES